jgi:ABC-type polysaccharide/polyol phosphate export permease
MAPEELTPQGVRRASSYGTGQLVAAALGAGIDELIVGLGGSATNDGGAGMAQALGFALLFSVANVFFRDVEHLLGVIFLPWFFLTPILYSLEQLPAASAHRAVIELMRYGNPVTPYVEGMRSVVLFGVVPGATLLLYIFLVGPALALTGLYVLQRYEDRLAVEL